MISEVTLSYYHITKMISISHRSLRGGPGPDPEAFPYGPGPTAKTEG